MVPEDSHNAFYPGAIPRVFNRPDFLDQEWESARCAAMSGPKHNNER
jgi:hypothetical protein